MKEPIAPEYGRLREGLVLFTYLHIAADEPLTRALVDSGITAVAYETVETDDRRLPLLAPMSEVAGRLAPQAGAHYLEKAERRPRAPARRRRRASRPAKVVVIGGGIVGYNAAVIALGLGAQVTILERSVDRMRHLEEVLHGRVTLADVDRRSRSRSSIADADLVIGAVLIPGALAPKLVTREMVAGMKDGSRASRRRDRPGRLRRDLARDDARRSRLRGRRRHPLLRREHARRRPDHVDEGADERDAAVRRGDRRPRARRRRSPRTRRSRRASTCSTGKITYEAVAEAHGLTYTPLDDVARAAARSRGALRPSLGLELLSLAAFDGLRS